MQRLGAADKTLNLLPGFNHAIFHEKDRRLVTDQIRVFVTRLFAAPPAVPPEFGRSRQNRLHEDRIRSLLGEPRTLRALVRRAVFATVGRLSRGVSLGLRSGFDSGAMLGLRL